MKITKIKETNDNNIFGKRKFIFSTIFTSLFFIMTFTIVFKFGKDSKDIITWEYIVFGMIVIGLYPMMNVISKFASNIVGKKLNKTLDSVSELINAINNKKEG